MARASLRDKRTKIVRGIDLQTGTLLVNQELDTSQFNPETTPCVFVTRRKKEGGVIHYWVEIRGRADISLDTVLNAVNALLGGDTRALEKLSLPRDSYN